ncbi:MAG: CBS domain-containing protein [Candidatus Aenigmarchaeota archaeon]|nr:CBS domain-containing protein [Candidatus Aenigmarchaeota archaeon]
MIVRDVMTENPVVIDFNATMGDAANLIQRTGVHELMVVRNGETVGMLSCRSLIERSVKPEQKVSGSIFVPASLSPDDTLESAVETLLTCGSRDLPVTEGGRLVGVVSEIDVIKTVANNRTANDVMRPIKYYLKLGDFAADARSKIIRHNINRLPVLDAGGRLQGIVSTIDLIGALFPQKSQRVGERSGEKTGDVIVDNLMEKKIFTVARDEKISKVTALIKNNRVSSIIVVGGGVPVGIITPKCLLGLMPQQKEVSTNVAISGLSGHNTDNKAAVERLVRKSVARMERLTNPISIALDFKEHRKQENRGKTNYEIKARAKTSDGNFFATSSGWKLQAVVNDVLDSLEREIKKSEGKRA